MSVTLVVITQEHLSVIMSATMVDHLLVTIPEIITVRLLATILVTTKEHLPETTLVTIPEIILVRLLAIILAIIIEGS